MSRQLSIPDDDNRVRRNRRTVDVFLDQDVQQQQQRVLFKQSSLDEDDHLIEAQQQQQQQDDDTWGESSTEEESHHSLQSVTLVPSKRSCPESKSLSDDSCLEVTDDEEELEDEEESFHPSLLQDDDDESDYSDCSEENHKQLMRSFLLDDHSIVSALSHDHASVRFDEDDDENDYDDDDDHDDDDDASEATSICSGLVAQSVVKKGSNDSDLLAAVDVTTVVDKETAIPPTPTETKKTMKKHYAETLTPVPNDGPAQMEIKGAGAEAVNGVYVQDGYSCNACRYKRRTKVGTSTTGWVYLYQHLNERRGRYWYLSIAPSGHKPGVTEDKGLYTVMYKAPVHQDCIHVPPQVGWETSDDSIGQNPAPRIRHLAVGGSTRGRPGLLKLGQGKKKLESSTRALQPWAESESDEEETTVDQTTPTKLEAPFSNALSTTTKPSTTPPRVLPPPSQSAQELIRRIRPTVDRSKALSSMRRIAGLKVRSSSDRAFAVEPPQREFSRSVSVHTIATQRRATKQLAAREESRMRIQIKPKHQVAVDRSLEDQINQLLSGRR